MKFTTTQAELSRVIGIASRAVSAKTMIPSLKSLKFDVSGSKLSIYGTDLNVSIKAEMDVTGVEDGSAFVDAKLLGNVIKSLPNSLISVSTNGNICTIDAMTSTFDLAMMTDDGFPDFASISGGDSFSIKTADFLRLVQGTTFAASVDDKKGVLKGCLFTCKDGDAQMVALDGFRLASAKESAPEDAVCRAIINAPDLMNVAAILKETGAAEVLLTVDNGIAKFDVGEITIISRLLSGEYVSYEQIIPKTHTTRMTVDKDGLMSALNRASLLAREGKNNLVKFNISADTCVISSRSEEGRVIEKLDAETDGADLTIGFNAKYILEALKAVSDDTVSMELTSPVSAALIRPEEGDAFTHLVLPVRLSQTEQ